ncbi:unnamed protein product [Vicia faba]|uniref:Transmembrane protein n=1 Tax=Vicia faba TaxID=3906 RepID=A0AAV0Z969_VICFA|nr:unnamed protein product [Vicia faba]
MEKNFSLVFVILLSFSYLLHVSSIPTTRTKNLNFVDASVFPSFSQENSFMEMENSEKMMEERLLGRRVDLELHDYEGPGANKEHDPKSPGGNG